MNKVFDTIVQSCEELGTLQQDGTIFLDTEQIKKCKTINQDLSLQGVEEEYRRRTFTTKREEYITKQLKIYEDMKKRVVELQKQYLQNIEKLARSELTEQNYNMEKTKYTDEKMRLLKEMSSVIDTIRADVTNQYYAVEQVQYKDLVNRMFRIQSLDDEKTSFQLNLDTTEQQLKNLLQKRKKLQRRYVFIMSIFLIVSSVFIGLFIYYLFSKNTL